MKNAFAHLLSSKATAAAKKSAVKEEDEEGKKAEEEKDDKKAKKEGKKCDDDDADAKAEEEKDEKEEKDEEEEGEKDEDKDDKEDKKGKKGKKASADFDRAKQIMASPFAAGQPDVAADLAFNSTMSVAEAENRMMLLQMDKKIDANAKANGPRKMTIDERMASVKSPNVGIGMPEGGNTGASAYGNLSLEAMEKMSPAQRAELIVKVGAESHRNTNNSARQ